MYLKSILFSLIFFLVSGCALYPTTRTYFEPNPEDGSLQPSSSCGYHAAKNDSLVREVDNFELHVTPHYKEGEKLKLTVLVQSKENNVTINANKIRLSSSNQEHASLPVEVKENTYEPRSNWPYYMKWNHMTYPPLSESLESITITFDTGSIVLDGKPLKIKPFRFNKTTKKDIYYSSINC